MLTSSRETLWRLIGPLCCTALAVGAVWAVEPGRSAAPGPDAALQASAARRLLALLEPEKRSAALMDFEDQERRNWHFVPRERRGLALSRLDEAERAALEALLSALFSEQGLAQMWAVIGLEEVLFKRESQPGRPASWRDTGRYYLSLFGDLPDSDPSARADASPVWGWRFEGHHLSLNVTLQGEQVAVTPQFFGANPADPNRADPNPADPGGPKETPALALEESLGRELAVSLDAEQRKLAFQPGAVPADVILGPGREGALTQLEGIPYPSLNEAQRALLFALLDEYLNNLRGALASSERERIESAGSDQLHFLWCGSLEPFEPHYYRISGPTFTIEYDNVQNGANHIHTLWRDRQRDFGDDLLRVHHQHEHESR